VVLASAYAEDDTHAVKGAVETAVAELGWTADPWTAEVRAESMRLATTGRALAQLRVALGCGPQVCATGGGREAGGEAPRLESGQAVEARDGRILRSIVDRSGRCGREVLHHLGQHVHADGRAPRHRQRRQQRAGLAAADLGRAQALDDQAPQQPHPQVNHARGA
jgi:hypothetical protein